MKETQYVRNDLQQKEEKSQVVLSLVNTKTRVNYIMKVGASCHLHVINLMSCSYLGYSFTFAFIKLTEKKSKDSSQDNKIIIR